MADEEWLEKAHRADVRTRIYRSRCIERAAEQRTAVAYPAASRVQASARWRSCGGAAAEAGRKSSPPSSTMAACPRAIRGLILTNGAAATGEVWG